MNLQWAFIKTELLRTRFWVHFNERRSCWGVFNISRVSFSEDSSTTWDKTTSLQFLSERKIKAHESFACSDQRSLLACSFEIRVSLKMYFFLTNFESIVAFLNLKYCKLRTVPVSFSTVKIFYFFFLKWLHKNHFQREDYHRWKLHIFQVELQTHVYKILPDLTSTDSYLCLQLHVCSKFCLSILQFLSVYINGF